MKLLSWDLEKCDTCSYCDKKTEYRMKYIRAPFFIGTRNLCNEHRKEFMKNKKVQ